LMLRTWFDFFGARFESGNLNLRFLLWISSLFQIGNFSDFCILLLAN
jgi:hypothetical protein